MQVIDIGHGPAVVVIPGIQGRWEWMRPGIEALSQSCRVITFSLTDGPRFESYVEQVREAMDERGIPRAAICGVSFGGLIAAAFAARYPERTSALALVSALPPSWQPDARAAFFLRAPRLLSPLFCIGSLRLYPEIARAAGTIPAGLRLAAAHGWNVITHMFSPARMARRVALLAGADLAPISGVRCPTLVITGERGLDRVVPVEKTAEYLALLPQARAVTLPRTGHLGFITRPQAFAGLLVPFVQAHAARQIG